MPGSAVSRREPLLLIAAYVLLAIAWVGGNPPFAAPDEASHYVRAIGLAGGDLVGEPVPFYPPDALTPEQLAIVRQQARIVEVPAGLSPTGWSCFVGRPDEPAACLDHAPRTTAPTRDLTPVGTYPPAPYLVPGAAARTAGDPGVANGLGRGGGAALGIALIGAAALALARRDGGAWTMAGLAVATTPMALFTVSALNPSGLEIAAALALAAGLLRLEAGRGWPWALIAFAAAALALSRSTGPLWLAVLLIVFAVWHGRELPRILRQWPAVATGVLLAAALLAGRLYERVHGPHVAFDVTAPGPSVGEGLRTVLDAVLRQAIGMFGYAELPLPTVAYAAWWVAAFGLFVLAVAVGSRRQRLALAAGVAGVAAVIAFLEAALLRPAGFHVQGRHLLPGLVLLPVLCGAVLADAAARLTKMRLRALPAVVMLVTAAVQLSAWLINAHRAAVGTRGTWWFALRPAWDPPGGWIPWLLVAAAGAAAHALAVRRGGAAGPA
jgi:hypothetical protein